MTLRCDFRNMILIVISFYSLYKDINTNITSFLETGNKTIDQIQNIFYSKKTKNISKQATVSGTGNLAIIFKNKNIPKRRQIVTMSTTIAYYLIKG